MNTATQTAAVRATNNTLLGKLRALALRALNLHLQNCAMIAETYRRPQ
ncbi:hypothetical protein [Paraburkholderia ginsengiterrae]|nr:hypothetical protein [Paraburkholderia ginsengiterrae]